MAINCWLMSNINFDMRPTPIVNKTMAHIASIVVYGFCGRSEVDSNDSRMHDLGEACFSPTRGSRDFSYVYIGPNTDIDYTIYSLAM